MASERSVRVRLATMMFLTYLILGAWVVTLAAYLLASPLDGGLNFTPTQVGWIYSTIAVGGLIGPPFIGLLADRLFPAERLLGCFQLIAAGLLALAASWCGKSQPDVAVVYRSAAANERVGERPLLEVLEQSEARRSREVQAAVDRLHERPEIREASRRTFRPLFGLMLGYSVVLMLAITLANVVAMRNLHEPARSYGGVRLYGTVGWMIAGFAVELGMRPVSAAPLWLAAAGSFVLGVYALVALPHTPPTGRGRPLADAFGLSAIAMLRDRSFAALVACGVALAVLQQFYNVFANPFLRDLGVPRPALVQTVAQISEVLCMLSFPFAVARWGLRGMMLIGLVGWALRNGVFATGSVAAVVGLGLPLHGLAYSYFFIVLSLYVDHLAPAHLRASAQGMLTFIVVGIGSWAGNAFSAAVVEAHQFGDAVAWSNVWLVPTVGSVVVTAVFVALVRPPNATTSSPDRDPNAPEGQPKGEA